MDGIYYAIKHKATGVTVSPSGTSKAPHLYTTKGKAEARRKSIASGIWADQYEVVPVQLTEMKGA